MAKTTANRKQRKKVFRTTAASHALFIKEQVMESHECQRRIAAELHSWMTQFMGSASARPSDAWFEEVWEYLPRIHWSRSRIEGYLYLASSPEVAKIPGQHWKLVDTEAIIWLGSPGNKVSAGDLGIAWLWMRGRWRRGKRVDKAQLRRKLRRCNPIHRKLYFEDEIEGMCLKIELTDPELSCTEARNRLEKLVRTSRFACSSVVTCPSGNNQENRPTRRSRWQKPGEKK